MKRKNKVRNHYTAITDSVVPYLLRSNGKIVFRNTVYYSSWNSQSSQEEAVRTIMNHMNAIKNSEYILRNKSNLLSNAWQISDSLEYRYRDTWHSFDLVVYHLSR